MAHVACHGRMNILADQLGWYGEYIGLGSVRHELCSEVWVRVQALFFTNPPRPHTVILGKSRDLSETHFPLLSNQSTKSVLSSYHDCKN